MGGITNGSDFEVCGQQQSITEIITVPQQLQ
jgi:hypothetical protein